MISLPTSAFSLNLDDKEFRLLAALCHLSGPQGAVEATMAELGILTGRGEENVRRALRGLERHGLVTTVRTKRNLGRLYKNRYTLTHCTVGSEVSGDAVTHHTVGSTDGHVVPDGYSIVTTGSSTSRVINTTYLFGEVPSPLKEETMNRWQDDDDEIAGVGLFPDELPAKQAQGQTSDKRKPATRGRRPVTEWTSYDVAAEFSYRLSRKFPLIPGLVNVKELAGTLAKNRKNFGITPVVEMELMEMFFGDERRWRSAEAAPHLVHRKFIRMFTTELETALNNLGMIDEMASPVDSEDKTDYIYASDGTRFVNSHLGRKSLERHENELEQHA